MCHFPITVVKFQSLLSYVPRLSAPLFLSYKEFIDNCSCKNETLSTLRFAQRAKAIKNKAVVNEIMQDDVNILREQIRQLKVEFYHMSSFIKCYHLIRFTCS